MRLPLRTLGRCVLLSLNRRRYASDDAQTMFIILANACFVDAFLALLDSKIGIFPATYLHRLLLL